MAHLHSKLNVDVEERLQESVNRMINNCYQDGRETHPETYHYEKQFSLGVHYHLSKNCYFKVVSSTCATMSSQTVFSMAQGFIRSQVRHGNG